MYHYQLVIVVVNMILKSARKCSGFVANERKAMCDNIKQKWKVMHTLFNLKINITEENL